MLGQAPARASSTTPTQLKAKGVDTIACMAVNDVFVMKAWGEHGKAAGKVEMLADGNGEYARALGLELDASKFGMGTAQQALLGRSSTTAS